MPRSGRIGIEIAPEAVRAVALSRGRRPRLLAWAEREVSSLSEVPDALSSLLEEISLHGPTCLLLSDPRARIIELRLPKMSGQALREAIETQGSLQLEENPEGYHLTFFAAPPRADGRRRVTLHYLPREPLETWASLLAAANCPVNSVLSTAARALSELPDERSTDGVLRVDVGGSRGTLAILRGRALVELCELPLRHLRSDDPVAIVEKRLADFQEIENALNNYQQKTDRRGIRRILLVGARELTTPLREQLLAALPETMVEVHDPWSGVVREGLLDETTCGRLAGAAWAARGRNTRFAIVPKATRRYRHLRRRGQLGIAAAAVVCLLSLLLLGQLNKGRDELRAQRQVIAERLASLPPSVPNAAQVAPPPTTAVPVPNWSGVLTEVGLMAQPGIDYARLVLAITPEGPLLGVEGRTTNASTQETGLLLAGLHEGLRASPYGSGLPRIALRSNPDANRAEQVDFAIEGVVHPKPDTGGDDR